jgi:hypothetical protein
MAAGRFVVPPYFPARDRDFNLLSGALLYVYQNETTTKANIYTDEALTVLSSNPVVANSSGQFPAVYAEAGTEASPVLYSVSVTTSTGASPGNPFNFDNYRPSVDWETATLALAEAAADAAAGSAAEAAADLTSVESIYDDILAIEATGSDAPAIAARALRDGSNLTGSEPTQFRTAIAAVGSAELAASGGSALVGFLQSGTGASSVVVQNKLRQAPVQPNSGEFGTFTNATVTTATLLAAFTAAMADGRPIELEGSYTINGPITPVSAVDGVSLHIRVKGDVTITVDSGATAFNRVFYAESTTAVNHSISGDGTLTIDCNNKAACGVWLRHTEAAKGGEIVIDPVTVRNVLAPTGVSVASGIFIIGRYERVILRSPTVEDVSRTDVSGECSGISVSDIEGVCEMYSPVVKRVLTGPATVDGDGIKGFGYEGNGVDGSREGSVRIYNPVFEDCQGRSYKDQCSDTVIYSPIVKRDAAVVVAISDSVEFDFQRGNGLLLNARYEYKKDGSTSPVGASHSCVVFQQVNDDLPMCAKAINATLVSDIIIPRYALLVLSAGAELSETVIDGLDMIPSGALATTMIDRSVIEMNMATASLKTTGTIIRVKNVRGPNTSPLIGYTGLAAIDSGTATAGGATTLTDSGQAWTTDVYAGFEVRITSGTGSGQRRSIASNTGTVLTVSTAWAVNPDATSVYGIFRAVDTTLTWDVGEGCHNTLGAGSASKGFRSLSGSTVLAVKEFRNIPAPGYTNQYIDAGFVCDFRALTVGTVITVDVATGVFTNAPSWGSSGYAHIRVEGQWFDGDYKTIWVVLNGATATPSFWFTQVSGGSWAAIK